MKLIAIVGTNSTKSTNRLRIYRYLTNLLTKKSLSWLQKSLIKSGQQMVSSLAHLNTTTLFTLS